MRNSLACPKGRALRCIPDLEKLRQKKPCFSKSGDVASIPHANPVFITSFLNIREYLVQLKTALPVF